jgi:hypothetical protein
MKKLFLSILVLCTLGAVVGCSDDHPATTTTQTSASMTTDTKDMHPVGQ